MENPGDSLIGKSVLNGSEFLKKLKELSVLFGLKFLESFFNQFGKHLTEFQIPLTQMQKVVCEDIDVEFWFELTQNAINGLFGQS